MFGESKNYFHEFSISKETVGIDVFKVTIYLRDCELTLYVKYLCFVLLCYVLVISFTHLVPKAIFSFTYTFKGIFNN